MPNWCYSSIKICHNDKEALKEFVKKLKKWTSKSVCKTDFGNYWLGNVVANSGIARWEKRGETYEFVPFINCRGKIETFELRENVLTIITETAWSPMLQMWKMIVEKYLPDADIWFTAEEPSNGIYETNDPDIVGCYNIDIFEPPEEFENEEPVYIAEEDDVIDFLQRVLKTEESDIDKLLSLANDLEDCWFAINVWNDCNIDYCD